MQSPIVHVISWDGVWWLVPAAPPIITYNKRGDQPAAGNAGGWTDSRSAARPGPQSYPATALARGRVGATRRAHPCRCRRASLASAPALGEAASNIIPLPYRDGAHRISPTSSWPSDDPPAMRPPCSCWAPCAREAQLVAYWSKREGNLVCHYVHTGTGQVYVSPGQLNSRSPHAHISRVVARRCNAMPEAMPSPKKEPSLAKRGKLSLRYTQRYIKIYLHTYMYIYG